MSARKRQSESLEFGSDSFLDIVANIVGILIILIVIAGVRMSQTPLAQVDSPEPEPAAEIAVPADQLVQSTPVEPEPVLASAVDPDVILAREWTRQQLAREQAERERARQAAAEARRRAYEREPEIHFAISLGQPESPKLAENPQLQADLARLEQETAQLRQQQADQAEALRSAQAALEQTRIQQQQRMQDREATRRNLAQLEETTQAVTTQLSRHMREQANLDEQLVLIQRDSTPAETIAHSMVPISKQVAGHEWHFEVREGKVSFIPLDELMKQLGVKIERWAEWIAKYDTHEGLVGPIEGFALEYKVSRQRQSLVDELTRSSGTFRIGLDRWELIPSGSGYAETLEQASKSNSQFRSTLNRCSLDDTITLWVYPDSFAMYQELSKIAHQMGYRVAARPLPAGRKIGGSPQGTKSVSQ